MTMTKVEDAVSFRASIIRASIIKMKTVALHGKPYIAATTMDCFRS